MDKRKFCQFHGEEPQIVAGSWLFNQGDSRLGDPELIQCMLQWTARNVHDA